MLIKIKMKIRFDSLGENQVIAGPALVRGGRKVRAPQDKVVGNAHRP